MNDYRYTLEPYNGIKTRYRCPNCNKNGVFSKYIDTHTSNHLSDAVGCCNRLIKCSYHYKPIQYFQDNNITFDKTKTQCVNNRVEPKAKPKTSFIDVEVMNKSKASKYPNYFIDYLACLWDYDVAYYLADKYHIGTSKHWQGATVFWQVDAKGRGRTGKIMLYNATSGKRVKKPYNHITWVHKVVELDSFNLEQCYFGEHLLKEDTSKPVAIVESEKTAVISSVYLPEFIWLATGGVNNINKSKTNVLKGRSVVFFPDLGCYSLWKEKINKLDNLSIVKISDLLEKRATEKEKSQGLDLADYLVKIK